MSKANIEALKEVLRYVVFGAIAFVIAAVLDKLALMDQTDLQIVVLTAVLRYIDKYLHKSGKVVRGLAQF